MTKQINFPARKVARQLKAKGVSLDSEGAKTAIDSARGIRTKKYRGEKGKRNQGS